MDQVIAPPTSFFVLAPDTILGSHKGFSLSLCLFVLLDFIFCVKTNPNYIILDQIPLAYPPTKVHHLLHFKTSYPPSTHSQ